MSLLDHRTPEEIARERAELLAATDEPRPRLRPVRDLEPVDFDPASFVRALRERQAALPPEAAASPESLEVARVARRRRWLEQAGIRDIDCLAALSPSPDSGQVGKARPPPLADESAAQRELWSGVVRFARTPQRRTLLVAGTTGTGKSWAAAWLCAEVEGARWVPGTLVEPTDEWRRVRAGLLRAPLVVFPDLTFRTSTWAGGQIADVLEQRHDEGRRTALVTNLDDNALRPLLGDPALSRIADARYGLAVRVAGDDLRRRAR